MAQKTSAFARRFFSAFLAMVLSFSLAVPVAYADGASQSSANEKRISVGETITLTVSGWNCSVEWASADANIATVTPKDGIVASSALVKGIKPGTVKVTAIATRVWDFWWQAHKVTSEFEITVKEQSYTVKFVANGGTRVSSQSVIQGQTATRPEDPIKCGYAFNGWYEDPELLYEYDFSTPVNGNLTLYAGWKKESVPAIVEKQIKVGEKIDLTYSANICAAVWKSSNSEVAAVTSCAVGKNCEVTGINAGTAFLTASPINLFSLIKNKGTVIAQYKIVVVEPAEPTEPTEPTEPETPSEADEYYESNSDVISVINAKESDDVQTETEVANMLEERGFVDCLITYSFSMDGEYCDETEVADGSTNKHPVYQALYVSENSELWSIFVINGEIFANPASFNLEYDLGAMLLISESEKLTSYSNETNQFFVTIPKESAAIVKTVEKIDAETLDKLTVEVIKTL